MHQLNSVKIFPLKNSSLLCTDRKQGGIFHFLEIFQKSQVLECSETLKNEVLSNLEGVDFWVQNLKK